MSIPLSFLLHCISQSIILLLSDELLYHGTAMFLVQFFSCHFKSYSVLILNYSHYTVTLTNLRVFVNVCFLSKNGFRHNLATHGKHSF